MDLNTRIWNLNEFASGIYKGNTLATSHPAVAYAVIQI